MSNQTNFVIYCGDALEILTTLESESINCCITSPPYYGLRDYEMDGQIGLEETPDQYIDRLVSVFREVRRVLCNDGTLWVNIGDSYAANRTVTPTKGLKPKDLIGIPWMLAFALRADGWYLRSEIIWHKPNPMPESVKDRPTKAHEQIFLFSKSSKYFYDAKAIREPCSENSHGSPRINPGNKQFECGNDPSGWLGKWTDAEDRAKGRNKRTVWTVTPKPFKGAHFAVFPPEIPKTCLLAGCPEDGLVLDPFSGTATTGIVAVQNGRRYVGIELNPDYVKISNSRFKDTLKASLNSLFV